MIKKKITKNIKILFDQEKELTPEQKQILTAWNSLNKPPSVIFYTTHKCASVFANNLFTTIADNSEYQFKNYASAISRLGDRVDMSDSYEDFLEKAYDQLYKTKGEIYAPQRRPLDFPGREKFKHIFFLRDPRDVLVSAYYSFGYSHEPPKGESRQQIFYERRKKIQEQGIDHYARDAAVNYLLPLYEKYKVLLETSELYLYLNYDEFKDNTTNFVQKIANFLEVDIPEQQVKQIADEASPIQQNHNTNQHKRSGKSQQYLEELESDTIHKLNETFADVLFYWNFPI